MKLCTMCGASVSSLAGTFGTVDTTSDPGGLSAEHQPECRVGKTLQAMPGWYPGTAGVQRAQAVAAAQSEVMSARDAALAAEDRLAVLLRDWVRD
jgi:hypothetical protein